MSDWRDWLHAVRNEANAISTSLAVVQRATTREDADTMQRFLEHGTQAMERLRLLLENAPDCAAASGTGQANVGPQS